MIAQGVAVSETDAKNLFQLLHVVHPGPAMEQKCGRYLSGSTVQEEKNSLAEITLSNNVLIDDS